MQQFSDCFSTRLLNVFGPEEANSAQLNLIFSRNGQADTVILKLLLT